MLTHTVRTDGAIEMAQQQSPGYPSFGLEKAASLGADIFDKDRKNIIDREVAAKHIGYSGRSGAADKALATLAHYGLVEKAGKGQVRVTQLLVDIAYPDSDEDRREALRNAGGNPKIFQTIRDRFDGSPSETALEAWLKREDFLERAIRPVTRAYLDTMQFLEQSKVFESGRDADDSSAESLSETETQGNNKMHEPVNIAPQSSASLPIGELNEIKAQLEGGTVRVAALLDKDGLEKLERKIQAFKALLED